MKNSIHLFFLLTSLLALAQNTPFYVNYTWDEKPVYDQFSDATQQMAALKDKHVVEFAYDDDNNLTKFYLEHKILWLNSDDKIEAYNKVYLPYSSSSELLISKARVITKQGKVIVLNDSKILTSQDEETGKQYKYFAFEGVEKGGFIEYYYVEKTNPNYNGTAFRLQSSYVKKNVEFDLFAPKNLVFDFKSYNNIPAIVQDTLINDKLHWQLSLNEIVGLSEENQSPYQASRGMIIYKLDKNLKNNVIDISSYGTVAQNIYSFYYTEPSKKSKALIEAFLNNALSNEDMDEESKLRSLDRYIKTNIFLSEGNAEELKDLTEVLTKKVANATGSIKLYSALLSYLDIKHEMVITSEREDLKFDAEFEANNFLTDFLFYFPKTNTYLSPTKKESRYGFPPSNLTDNYGLFIKEVTVGDFKSGLGKIKYIESLEADKTVDRMKINVRFDTNSISKNIISLERSFTGYYGMAIHPYMHLIKDKDREDMIEGLGKSMNENVKVTSKEVRNESPELFGIKPLEFNLELESEAFLEKAGKKYLFKVGELIGRQIQMYQEKERTLPYEDEFKRSYYRTIRIELPKGYKVSNLDDLNIENTYNIDGKELLSFKSYYRINDNILDITADEHYRINIIKPAIFEEYRKVINSAADFNKITLVLEPTISN